MRAFLLVSIGVAACGASSRTPPGATAAQANAVAAPVAAREQAPARSSLAEQADQALEADAPLDYERPFADKPYERTDALELLGRACDAGHRPSCWKALAVAPQAKQPDFETLVTNNCRAGDIWSCRALPADDTTSQRFADLPGAEGRKYACRADVPYDPAQCRDDVLQGECKQGFRLSCAILARHATSQQESDESVARLIEVAQQGCAADLVEDCSAIAQEWPPDGRLEAAQHLCKLSRSGCRLVAYALEEQGEHRQARDAIEVACQYGTSDACLELATAYLDRRYAEPVPGRGQALLDFECQRLERVLHRPAASIRAACNRASR